MISKPKSLFKFEGMSIQSLRNLQNSNLYFGTPRNFNDPYDCALVSKLAEISEKEAQGLKMVMTNKTPISN